MRNLLTTIIFSLCVSQPVSAGIWTSFVADGIKEARVTMPDENELLVLCDVGIGAPITSVNFVVAGTVPTPASTVRIVFDKEAPIYAVADDEGGLGSVTKEQAEIFDQVIANLKSKSEVKIRLFDGSEAVFALRGSSDAIGQCAADFSRYQIAGN